MKNKISNNDIQCTASEPAKKRTKRATKYHKSLQDAFWSRVVSTDHNSCWIWNGCTDRDGYGVLQFEKRQYRAHRVSYQLLRSPVPDDLVVCHHCDNPSCVNPHHLFVGTVSDNNADRISKGRSARGEKSARAKLTEADVLEIRRMAAANCRTKEIADKFKVSYYIVSLISRGDSWKHVGGPLTKLKLAGSRLGQSKLNESQVLEIRKLVSEGTSKGEASRRFGVSRATIIRLCRLESWSHVGEAL